MLLAINRGAAGGAVLALVMVLVLAVGAEASHHKKKSRVGSTAGKGAGIGAGIGLFLGILTGEPDIAIAAAAVGAGAGAAEGAYEGWRQEQEDQRTGQVVDAIKSSSGGGQQGADDAAQRAREQLDRFLGQWQLKGYVVDDEGVKRNVSATVNGNVHMSVLVELDYLDLKAEGFDQQVWGTSTLGYDTDSGYSLTSRFNISPDPIEVSGGRFKSSSRSFEFDEDGYYTAIKFRSPDRFTVETRDPNKKKIESYTFTRIGD